VIFHQVALLIDNGFESEFSDELCTEKVRVQRIYGINRKKVTKNLQGFGNLEGFALNL